MENANQLVISKLGGREGADGAGRAALTERDPPPPHTGLGKGAQGERDLLLQSLGREEGQGANLVEEMSDLGQECWLDVSRPKVE